MVPEVRERGTKIIGEMLPPSGQSKTCRRLQHFTVHKCLNVTAGVGMWSFTNAGDGVVWQVENVQVRGSTQAVDGRQLVASEVKDSETGHVFTVHKGDVVFLWNNEIGVYGNAEFQQLILIVLQGKWVFTWTSTYLSSVNRLMLSRALRPQRLSVRERSWVHWARVDRLQAGTFSRATKVTWMRRTDKYHRVTFVSSSSICSERVPGSGVPKDSFKRTNPFGESTVLNRWLKRLVRFTVTLNRTRGSFPQTSHLTRISHWKRNLHRNKTSPS